MGKKKSSGERLENSFNFSNIHILISKEYDEKPSDIWIINLQNNQIISCIKFDGNIGQIYNITTIPNDTKGELLNINSSVTGINKVTKVFLIYIFNFREEIK